MIASFEFPDVVRVTQHVGSRVDYTPNIFIHSWGVNTTDMIPANVSTITQRAYDPIRSFNGFVLRSNHKRLRLKRIELKRIHFKELLARIFKMSVTMLLPIFVLPLITPWVMPCPRIPTPMTADSTITIPTDNLLIPSKM